MSAKVFAALIKVQKDMGPLLKDSKNPHFRNTYASLEAVIDTISEPLAKHGLGITQGIVLDSEGTKPPVLETKLIHESGEFLTTTYPLFAKDMADPQKLASSVTYARRYSLMAMFNLAAEDDDGNAAAGNAPSVVSGRSGGTGPSEAQVNFAKKLMADVRGAKTKKAADELSKQLTGKPFDQLTGYELSKKIIDPLKAEQGGPGF